MGKQRFSRRRAHATLRYLSPVDPKKPASATSAPPSPRKGRGACGHAHARSRERRTPRLTIEAAGPWRPGKKRDRSQPRGKALVARRDNDQCRAGPCYSRERSESKRKASREALRNHDALSSHHRDRRRQAGIGGRKADIGGRRRNRQGLRSGARVDDRSRVPDLRLHRIVRR